jgi:hypothetical protein
MRRVTWTRRLLVIALLAAVAGCASYQPPPRASTPPRTRCLSDPNETGLRPLIFLFCMESP